MKDPFLTLQHARRRHYEDPAGVLREAQATRAAAEADGDAVLEGRALALEIAVAIHRGDLVESLALLREAERFEAEQADDTLLAELAAMRSHLGFFAGSYAESLVQAERSIELADRVGDPALRIFTRRSACLVFGNVGIQDWPEHLAQLLKLTIESGDRYEEALSRNDLAHSLMLEGDLVSSERQLDHAHALAIELAPENQFLLGVLSCTRGEMRLRGGRPADALECAITARDLLERPGAPNPYVLAVTVLAQIQALLALDRLDDAVAVTRRIVTELGDTVPQARGQMHSELAAALRAAGRLEEAYVALEASVELERRAFAELSELQRGLDRAALTQRAVRKQTDALTERNRRLEAVHDRLREQVDRDALTGLHNRRYLSRELERQASAPDAGPFSLAALDLDHFKTVNDRFGHAVGDHVLIRVAALLLDTMREQDVVVRTGGEEFVLFMPQTAARAAVAACERLRTAVRDEPWHLIADGLVVTTSIGVETAEDGTDLEAVAARADQRLYEAKRAGRDRVVPAVAELPLPRG